MNEQKKSFIKTILSIINKLLITVFMVVGIAATSSAELLGGAMSFLYFTIQSNLWIGAICFVFAILQILGLKNHKNYFKKWLYVLKFMFTTSITLTFMVMTFMLTPVLIQEGQGAYLGMISNVFPHYLVPLLAIADYFLFDTGWEFKTRDLGYSAIMPIYYLIFALSCGAAGVAFSQNGDTFPYFFLDHEAMGWFSASNPAGKYGAFTFGVVWWILILTVFVLLMAWGYIVGLRACKKGKVAKIPFAYEEPIAPEVEYV